MRFDNKVYHWKSPAHIHDIFIFIIFQSSQKISVVKKVIKNFVSTGDIKWQQTQQIIVKKIKS